MKANAHSTTAGDASGPASPSTVKVSSMLDATIRIVLLAYIAVLPFKGLLVVERNGFLFLLGLLVVWCLVRGRVFYRKTPYDMWLLSFVLWVGLTIPFSAFPQYSLKEYGKLLQWMVVFYAVVYFLWESRYRRLLVVLVGLSAVVVVGYGLTQFTLTNPQAVMSFLPAEVWLTTFLVMMIPFGLAAAFGEGSRVAKSCGAMMSVLAIGCLLLTQSRAGLAAFLAELFTVAWLVRSVSARVTAALITVCLLTGLFFAFTAKTPEASNGTSHLIPVKTGIATIVHRLDIWRFTLSEIAKHWLVGIGYGGHTYLLLYGREGETVEPGHTSIKDKGTHNILLYLSLHVGLVGMAIFVWFYVSTIRTTISEYWRARDWMSKMVLAGMSGSLIGLFLRLQFDQMFAGSLALLFWVLLATAVLHYPSLRNATTERVP